MSGTRIIRIVMLSVIALIAAAGIAWWQVHQEQAARETGRTGLIGAAAPQLGGPFQLVDDRGAEVTDATYRGRYMLVYFGFTYCPDVCPTELATMARAIDLLGDQGGQVQPLFITVDPERDSVSAMHDYVQLFHPRLVGLTGTPEQIARAARAYRVYYARAESPQLSAYTMDHSSFVYLMGPDGRSLAVFPAQTSAEDMAQAIGAQMQG